MGDAGAEEESEQAFSHCPKFNHDMTTDEVEYHKETLHYMREDNQKRITNVTEFENHFFDPAVVNYLFTIAIRLKLHPMIRYQALYLFDGFISEHLETHYSGISSHIKEVNDQMVEWEKVESNLSRQLTLRMVSCLQLASKTYDCADSLTPTYLVSCLKALGHLYTTEAVLKSEIRVSSTVDFKLWDRDNPVVYIETILALLSKDCQFLRGSMKNFYHRCTYVFDCVLMNMKQIYNHLLFNLYTRTVKDVGHLRYNRILSDWFLLGTGVIYSAASTLDFNDTQLKEILNHLLNYTKVPEDNIKRLADAIEEVMAHKT
uniref:Cyclin N-terminal domain-containing protein 1 n=1 Tax=Rhabditophanes sp. KR3021 TaxID=114890 RepID=A0AC35U038_9BILA